MKKVNSITICKDNYDTREEWEDTIKRWLCLCWTEEQIDYESC